MSYGNRLSSVPLTREDRLIWLKINLPLNRLHFSPLVGEAYRMADRHDSIVMYNIMELRFVVPRQCEKRLRLRYMAFRTCVESVLQDPSEAEIYTGGSPGEMKGRRESRVLTREDVTIWGGVLPTRTDPAWKRCRFYTLEQDKRDADLMFNAAHMRFARARWINLGCSDRYLYRRFLAFGESPNYTQAP